MDWRCPSWRAAWEESDEAVRGEVYVPGTRIVGLSLANQLYEAT